MKQLMAALLVLSTLCCSVSTNAQIPILAGAYRDNPLKLTYTFVGLYTKPTITAVAKKDANGLPLAANLQPKVTVTADPIVPGVYAVVVGYDTTSNLPITSWLEIKLNGQIFAAGPMTIDRTNRSGSYAVFVNTVTLITTSGLNNGNGNGNGGVDLTQVTNLLKAKQDTVAGKGLSSNDFTDTYRYKLDTLKSGTVTGISQSFADGRYLLNTYVPTWSNLTGKPAFFSGNYTDLAGKPTIPTLPAWLPSSDPAYLTLTSGDGRYRLATVAIDYTALINKPTIPVVPGWIPTTDPGYLTSSYVPTWTSITGKPAFFTGNYLDLTNRPTLSTVAGTGSYSDLLNKPTIPAATVITNNATTTSTGTALDGVWGKILKDAVDANTAAIGGKLSIGDTVNFARKISGYRLISPAEQTKLANTSGSNTGDQTISISGSRITLSGGGGFVDVPSTGGSTPIANNLTTTTAGSALDATKGKLLNDTATVHRNDINAAKTLASTAQTAASNAQTTANSKQNAINSSTDLVANSVTVSTPVDSDSTRKVATTDWVRRYVKNVMPSFIDFPYKSSQFTFTDSLAIRTDYIRSLFSGSGYNPSTGVITGGSGSSGPWLTSGTTAYYNNPVGIGTSTPYSLFTVAGNAQAAEFHLTGANNAQTDSYKLGILSGFGPQIAGSWAFNSGGTMYNQGNGNVTADGNLFFRPLGRDDRAIFLNAGGITIGNGTNTATATVDVTGTLKTSGAAQIGGQLTVPSVKFAGDNSVMASAPATVCSSLAELAAATTRLAIYDGSHWVRVAGTVESNVGVNTVYTVTQYNSGSDHYERQFPGRAKFEWWRNSASNTWEQMKYAANSQLDVQVANGDYYFNERVYTAPGARIFGNETSPDSVRFHINGPNPYLFMNWPWMDGSNAMQGQYRKKAENIVLAGFSLYNESSFVASKDQNDFYGPISFDGGGSFNNVIRNIKYKQVSTTAIVNVILIKMGTLKTCESLLIDNIQTIPGSANLRMLVEVLNQGPGDKISPEWRQVPAKNVEIRNCVVDGARFGLSAAGRFEGLYMHHNIARNCTDYGIEFAGPITNGRCEYNGFGGSQNVLIAGNYVADSTADWVFPVGTGQRYIGNFTEGKVTGGYVEIRSGGNIDFSDNNFQIDGGVLLQNTTFAGVRSGQFTRNRIISTMTNSNWRGQAKAILFMNGATGLDVSSNYLERGGTDADALIQSNANGVSNVSNRFYNNVYQVGTNGTYYGNTSTTAVRFNNFDVTGTARN